MGKIADKQRKVREALKKFDGDLLGKCALCTETLVHVTKSVEAETGCSTRMVTAEIARKVKATAPNPKRLESKLRERVVRIDRKSCDKVTTLPNNNNLPMYRVGFLAMAFDEFAKKLQLMAGDLARQMKIPGF